MPKGIAQRRRLKRALEAARGNLHKIANGKALPNDLPEAPKPKDAEKLPASLRKMLALKELAAQKDRKGRKSGEDTAPPEPRGTKNKKASHSSEGAEDGPSTSGREEPKAQQHAKSGSGAATVKGAHAFQEQFEVKKLKDRKKEYLKRKEEAKRRKGAGGQVVVEKELQLKDNIKFGEVVHAPLQIHLKRKHWAEKEKTANERCKEVFLKQMQQAQQRLAGTAATVDEGIAVREGGGGAAAGKAGPQKKDRKRKAPMDEDTEELRQQVIDSYRAAKKGGGFHNASVGNATMASLSRLVGKSGGGASSGGKAGSAGSGKTHTLA